MLFTECIRMYIQPLYMHTVELKQIVNSLSGYPDFVVICTQGHVHAVYYVYGIVLV